MCFLTKNKKIKKERSCFRFKKRGFDFENTLSSIKWWSLRHPQWPKTIRFTLLTFCSKERKKIRFTIFVLRKNQRSPKISKFVMTCLLHWGFFFAALASCTCTYSRERERERERYEKQKVRCENVKKYCWNLNQTCNCKDFKICGSWDINV